MIGAGGAFLERVNVELEVVLEEPPERFQDAPLEVGIIFLVENVAQGRHAHDNADHVLRVAEKVRGEPVELRVIRDEHGLAERAEDVHPVQEVLVIDARRRS